MNLLRKLFYLRRIMVINIHTPSVTINNTGTCDLGPVLQELQSLQQKINQLMALIDDLKQQVTDLQTQSTEMQASIDLEQAQIAELLTTNAQVVTDLNTQIATLQEQLANSATPEALQEVINGLTIVKDSLATSKSDLEATV